MKTETAVQWLINCLPNIEDKEYLKTISNEALKKEKEQIIESGNTCAFRMRIIMDKINNMTLEEIYQEADKKESTLGEKYFEETFKN